MSLLMDALKKADAAKEPEFTESDNLASELTLTTIEKEETTSSPPQDSEIFVNDWDKELFIDFENNESPELNENISLNSQNAKKASSHIWDDEFLPEFQENGDKTKLSLSPISNVVDNSATEDKVNEAQITNDETEPTQPLTSPAIDFVAPEAKPQTDTKTNIIESPRLATTFHQPEDAKRVFAAGSANSSKRISWLIGISCVLLVGMGCGYYFYAQSLVNQPLTFNFRPPPRPVVFNQPTPEKVKPSPQTVVSSTPKLASEKQAPQLTKPIPKPPTNAVHKPSQLEKLSIKKFPVKPHLPVLTSKVTPPSTKSVQEPTNIHTLRKTVLPKINTELSKGYTALQRGDKMTAQKAYSKVLRQEPNNRDALLGLAALAWQNGNRTKAQQYYRQILHLNPQDSHAQLGLINSLGHHSPENERQLKQLLEQTPKSAHIHFTLGNFYAASGHWPQAQQAYFKALRYDNKQADYAYNLAVSLEHLNKPRLALSYYQRALQLSRKQQINFNNQIARKRVQTLLKKTKASALANLPSAGN